MRSAISLTIVAAAVLSQTAGALANESQFEARSPRGASIYRARPNLTCKRAPGVCERQTSNTVGLTVRDYVDAALEARHWNAKGFKHVAGAVGEELANFGAAATGNALDHVFSGRSYAADEEAFERREIDEQELARRSWIKTAFSVGKKLIGTFLKRDMSQFETRDLTADEHAFLHHVSSRDLTADEHAFLNHVSSRGYDADAEELARRSMSEEELERRSFWKSALKVGGKILGSFLKREDLTLEERELAEHFGELAARGFDGEQEELARRKFLKPVTMNRTPINTWKYARHVESEYELEEEEHDEHEREHEELEREREEREREHEELEREEEDEEEHFHHGHLAEHHGHLAEHHGHLAEHHGHHHGASHRLHHAESALEEEEHDEHEREHEELEREHEELEREEEEREREHDELEHEEEEYEREEDEEERFHYLARGFESEADMDALARRSFFKTAAHFAGGLLKTFLRRDLADEEYAEHEHEHRHRLAAALGAHHGHDAHGALAASHHAHHGAAGRLQHEEHHLHEEEEEEEREREHEELEREREEREREHEELEREEEEHEHEEEEEAHYHTHHASAHLAAPHWGARYRRALERASLNDLD